MNKSQNEIEELICRAYERVGGNCDDIAFVEPRDGSWGKALSYRVVKKDRTYTVIMRADIDDNNNQNIETSLGSFRSDES